MKNLIRLSSTLFILALAAQAVFAQTTAFKYQGKLTDAGAPQATYQMQFKLFDAASGGSQIGSTVENSSVSVADGVFSVSLDFGANAFAGADRFLEIAVRRSAGESYVTLNPRQHIASSPYSIRTLSAQQADLSLDSNKLGGINASEYVTNASVGSSFIRNGTTQQTANFNISGNGIFGGFAGFRTGINPNFTIDSFGPMRSFSTSAAHFVAETTGGTNSWARFYMRSPSRSWFMGTSQNFSGNQFYLVDETAGQTRMAISTDGLVGFGTSTPNTRLTLNGGVPWTSNGWTASMNLQTGSALGWEANASGQRFGIGQSGGGLYFFRTNSAFGNAANPANYDLVITDEGNVTQPLERKGLPKAMISVGPNGNILRCYNGATGVSTGNCGFTVTHTSTGLYRIDFGFQVNNRIFSLAFRFQGNLRIGTIITSDDPGDVNPAPTVNQIYVVAGSLSNVAINSTFYVIVY